MDALDEFYALINAVSLAIKRNANAALNQGNTRGLSIDDLVLIATINANGGCTMHALATLTNRDIASISRQVSTLCKRGWLAKRQGENDARERIVALTNRALCILPEAQTQMEKVLSSMASRLSPTEKKELCRMLGTLLEP